MTSSYNAETRTFSLKFRYTCWDFSFSFLVENHNLPHWLVILLTNSVWWGTFLSQEVPPTPGQPVKEPMFIPVTVGLLDSTGKDIPLSSLYHNGLLQSVASNEQPVYTTILRVTKVSSELLYLLLYNSRFCNSMGNWWFFSCHMYRLFVSCR